MEARQLWQTSLGKLQIQLPKAVYDTWLGSTSALSYEDGVLVVGVQSAYAKDWLENRLYSAIQKTVSEAAARTSIIRFVVSRNSHANDQVELLEGSQPAAAQPAVFDIEGSRINPKYTFDTYIIGQSNRLAHAGCQAVAENPGTSYNPLFIYGGAGLGKTHLLHAIGNYVSKNSRRALYVSAETFTNELINSIRNRTTDDFRAKYRTIDVLLLDDVQFIISKERTQEEFFHTFNDLYQENRQIVLSSDRAPRAFEGLEERLRSRFEWGLSVDIQPPDLETRMAILGAKAESRHEKVPGEVIEFIAQQAPGNVRELEGALNRVIALAHLMAYPLNVSTAQRALGDMSGPKAKVTMDDVITVVSQYYRFTVEDLLGPRRTQELALARQLAMYLARQLTDLSLPQIGSALGGRDHTTVMYGCDKIAKLYETDDTTRRQVMEIRALLSKPVQHEVLPIHS
ncbi:MAG: chromosomal replication initiator protein DnaA [Chloroflexi bacterium]|nr:chromosomal replication initiator protein DnaA [Chloroflexota bacterium]